MTLAAALLAHPQTPCEAVRSVTAEVALAAGVLRLSYRVAGEIARLVVPPPAAPQRRDGLWEHTCFEAFLKGRGGEAYVELNLSPSGAWAAYRFDGYRAGMAALDVTKPPRIALRAGDESLALDAEIVLPPLLGRDRPRSGQGGALQGLLEPPASGRSSLPKRGGNVRLGLSAVLEAADGRKSYWALAHPPGRPDFHDAAGFTLPLPEIA